MVLFWVIRQCVQTVSCSITWRRYGALVLAFLVTLGPAP